MSERKVWFITRPERDPKYHAEAIRALAEATNNFTTKWQGNRQAHKHFEEVLASKHLKRNNISNDGSGGRTWCAMLKTFSYCYIDHEGYVKPTKVGNSLIDGIKEFENVKKQILTLQIPNAYFLESGFRPKFASSFKIRPARFLTRIVQSVELEYYVTKEEITYFVLTAQHDNELQHTIDRILTFRSSDEMAKEEMKQEIAVEYDHRARNDHAARDYFQAHSDVAHTFMMLCEYTGLVEYLRGEAILKIDPDLIEEAKKVIAYYDDRYPFNSRYLISSERMAQNNGLDVDSYKANDFGTIKPASNQGKFKNKINSVLNTLPNANGMTKEELLPHFVPVFGPKEARKVVDELVINRSELTAIRSEFVEKYLGELSPHEFEEETVKILEAIGFEVEYQPKIAGKTTEIEIFVQYGEHCGIIDTKYYHSGFPLSQNLANYMGSEYIPNYLEYGDNPLAFYGYITSAKYTGEKKLQSVTALAERLTGHHIEGFMMQRDVLIGFLDYCLENELPIEQRVQLFVSAIQNNGIHHFKIEGL
ncbi:MULTISPECIES: AlwI family type II restriction endonuclease [Lysinibacillus]|uniref:AlwI family type II restriction endonuclease n=1 Tax=Lysinibacillus TaxID=400634 RepID=UPI002DB90BD8|nr:AlwI family type II restriction endonuclease [Lysinibacillus sphaericus]MEB7454369.1 AlwI family type II restriction endonuclease [Lysinibacillus sphaericus]WKT76886.1 AlwI family type II restriction endonuclease [Lysinibacillus fusiformis]